MTPERLRYAGRGQIVRESDGRLVSCEAYWQQGEGAR